ncbi:MAG: hypothetical protein V7739_08905 [Motiliproteus sp.]
MSKQSEPQYASVEQPFGWPPPQVHCPICGKSNVDTEDNSVDPCPHLAFMYGFSFSDFAYCSDDFNERTKNLGYNSITFENAIEYLKRAGYGNNLLAIEFTYGGMACGPSWTTDLYGFDFNTAPSDESS